MEKFWIIAVANEYNRLNERFYTYDEAVKEARKRASIDPSKVYNVLELKGYAEGELTISSDYNDEDEVLVIEVNQGDAINVHVKFEDSKGEPLDLSGCSVQFIVLPEPNSPDETAIYNGIKKYTNKVPLGPDEFTGSKADFIMTSDTTKEKGTFWYQVRIIYNSVPVEPVEPDNPEEPDVDGGVDKHTLALWHFNESENAIDKNGIVSNISYSGLDNQTFDTSIFKFSPTSLKRTGSKFFTAIDNSGESSIFNLFTHDFTIDFWHRMTSNLGTTIFSLGTTSSTLFTLDSGGKGSGGGGNNVTPYIKINGKSINSELPESTNQWNHIACCFKYDTKTLKVYLNGLYYGESTLDALPTGTDRMSLIGAYWSAREDWFDEFRISDIVRYTEDFEPPTEPYSLQMISSKEIRNTLDGETTDDKEETVVYQENKFIVK